jgi:cytochrome bd-type quinol oxidase subunit 2
MSTHDAIRDASIALAILNLVVSIAVASSAAYSGRQKIVQILIIWIAPVIGSVLFGLFMLTQRGNASRTGYPSESSVDIGQIWSGLNPPDQKQ